MERCAKVSAVLFAILIMFACSSGGNEGAMGTFSYRNSVGGTVEGLIGTGLVLQINSEDDLNVLTDGPFSFSTLLANGSSYTVTIIAQPTNPAQTCTVANGSGSVNGSNVIDIIIECGDPVFLDSTFGTDGTVTTALGSGDDAAFSSAIQPDGKIIAAGHSWNGSDYDFAVARYNEDGSFDTNFGTGGMVTTAISPSYDNARSVAIQADGKIILAGMSGATSDFAVVRYNTNGTLDSDFGTAGRVTTEISANSDGANAVAIQQDGKIVTAGFVWTISGYDFALVRYNTNGSVDTTFGLNGIVTTPVGAEDDSVLSIAMQSDGKIVAAGYSGNDVYSDFALARYNADGSLDPSFGTEGKVTTSFGANRNMAFGVAIQPDGKIIAVGYSGNDVYSDFALARYNADGSLDLSFGTGGKTTTTFGPSFDVAWGITIQSDGKIVAAGYAYNSNCMFALARYNATGSLDATFGIGGKITNPIVSDHAEARSVAIQSDGKIVAVGFSSNGSDYDFALARYLP